MIQNVPLNGWIYDINQLKDKEKNTLPEGTLFISPAGELYVNVPGVHGTTRKALNKEFAAYYELVKMYGFGNAYELSKNLKKYQRIFNREVSYHYVQYDPKAKIFHQIIGGLFLKEGDKELEVSLREETKNSYLAMELFGLF